MACVLHIEDDPKNRRLVRKLLVAAGHEVVDAETGLEGIRLANEYRPDLVLVDINVPDLDGYEVTLRLRGIPTLQGVPIVAITAEGDRETSLAVGADGFIAKPINAMRFARTIQRFLRGHREQVDDESGQWKLREQTHKIVERLERKVVELSEANQRLEEMVRLRREFLQNVSHELATPMTPVVGYLNLLLDEELGPLNDMQTKCLKAVAQSTNRLRSLVDTLIDVSSLETGRMRFQGCAYDFVQTVQLSIGDARARFESGGVMLHVEAMPTALPAYGDPDKLRRAIVLVLDNAAKFTPKGGEAAVGIRAGEHRGRAWYSLVVADGGPGVPANQVHKVLEPFYQVDGSATRSHGGAGLGLAFARRVCEALGGGLMVESPPTEKVAGRQLTGTLVRLQVQREIDPAGANPR